MFGFASGGVQLIPDAVSTGVDVIDTVHSVGIGVTVRPGDHNQPAGRLGVYLAHDARRAGSATTSAA